MGTPRRRLDNESDARLVLADLRESGLDFRDFTALRGYDGRVLRAWEKRLGPTIERPNDIRLVECALPRQSTYRIRTERFEIEVEDGFREDTLRRILQLVGEGA